MLYPDKDTFQLAVEEFHKYDRDDVDLVDTISFVTMGAASVRTALTKDGHFAMAGFTVLPPIKP